MSEYHFQSQNYPSLEVQQFWLKQIFLKKTLSIYFREREQACGEGRETEGDGERKGNNPQMDSALSMEPGTGLDPMNLGS